MVFYDDEPITHDQLISLLTMPKFYIMFFGSMIIMAYVVLFFNSIIMYINVYKHDSIKYTLGNIIVMVICSLFWPIMKLPIYNKIK